MQKGLLERFISKYNLGGSVETVIWDVKDKKLTTKVLSDDSNCHGVLTLQNVDNFEEGKYGIKNTSQLKKLLSVLSNDIEVDRNMVNNKLVALTFSDRKNKVNFVLSEPTSIPVVPDVENIPEYDLEIPFTSDFITTFTKAKSALPDVETFTILTAKKKTQLVLGYAAKINTTRVTIDIEPTTYKEITPISFSARYMKEILTANTESETGMLNISKEGVANIQFKIEGFELDYYIFEENKSE